MTLMCIRYQRATFRAAGTWADSLAILLQIPRTVPGAWGRGGAAHEYLAVSVGEIR